jgi:hypothetical protein
MVMVTYNLMSLFRLVPGGRDPEGARGRPVHAEKPALQAIRLGCFIITEDRTRLLKLAVAMRLGQWMEGFWDRSKTFHPPVAFSPLFNP